MGNLIYLKNVVTLQLDESKCTGCGICREVCPHAVLALKHARAVVQNRDACMECGACSRNCPSGAISVQSGVGCAAAVINSLIGRTGSECSCSLEPGNNGLTSQGECCR